MPQKPGENLNVILNLVKIDTADVPESTFELPSGMKKFDINTLSQMLKK